MLCNDVGQRRRDRVTDLHADFDTFAAELEVIGESLQACSLPVSDRAMFLGMEVTTFFRLVELGAT